MSVFALPNVRLLGVATAVPARRAPIEPSQMVGPDDLNKIIAATGVKSRHVAASEVCASDLCAGAARRLMEKLGWEASSVDLILFVSQTPDFVMPATACSLHGRLGLAKSCGAFDINLGCSGYVYGLSIAGMHIHSRAARRVLLLVGDTISKVASDRDRSVAFLFGDAGSATALDFSAAETPIHFVTGSDGAGARHLQIPAGMFRTPSTEQTRAQQSRESGNLRSDEQLYMNGPEIFNFTIREVPPLVNTLLNASGWGVNDIDYVVMHQANRFMLDYLVKRMKLPADKVIMALEEYGNTSSASIPLAICNSLSARLARAPARILLVGFGVGFSWGAAAIDLKSLQVEPVFEM